MSTSKRARNFEPSDAEATAPSPAKKEATIDPRLSKIFETDAPIDCRSHKHSQALRLAKHHEADKPMGTASIASCLALVLALISEEAVKAKLLSFLGFRDAQELLSLKDPCRFLSAILSPIACTTLEQSPHGATCKQLWEALGAECTSLGENLEAQLNEMLKKAWETTEDVFKPFQLVPKDQVPDLIATLVSMEKICVSWQEEIKYYIDGNFTTATGTTVPAKFCVDTRQMNGLKFEGGEAVLLRCKPDEKSGKERGMIFVLPPKDNQDLDTLLAKLATHADKSNGIRFGPPSKCSFRFPAFDAKMAPTSIRHLLDKHVPEIFDPMGHAMEGTLPAKRVGGTAYVSDVQHGASIKADRKGAEAKAVTVTTVYRSLGPALPEFHCNRPFLSILVELVPGTVEVRNVEFVTKHASEKTLDLSVQ